MPLGFFFKICEWLVEPSSKAFRLLLWAGVAREIPSPADRVRRSTSA